MIAKGLAVVVAVIAGGWMVFDGVHVEPTDASLTEAVEPVPS